MENKIIDVSLSGTGLISRTTTPDLGTAMNVMSAFRGTDASGYAMDGMTGEVVVTMENGMFTSMCTTEVVNIVRHVYVVSPERAHVLMAAGVGALAQSEDAINAQTAVALYDLHEELFGRPLSDLEVLAGTMTIALMAMLGD